MSEIGMDPHLLLHPADLNQWLDSQIKQVTQENPAKMNLKQKFDTLIEAKIEPRCQAPSFIMNHPMVMSPLAKSHAQGRSNMPEQLPLLEPSTVIDDKVRHLVSERFEFFVGGVELANAYSE